MVGVWGSEVGFILGELGNDLSAGSTNPIAGAFSPMVIDLAREDGEQNLASLQITLPDGELAKLREAVRREASEAGDRDRRVPLF